MHLPWDSYVCVFLDKSRESRQVKRMIDRTGAPIHQIPIEKPSEDVPRLVTEERVFQGYREIREYCEIWLPRLDFPPWKFRLLNRVEKRSGRGARSNKRGERFERS